MSTPAFVAVFVALVLFTLVSAELLLRWLRVPFEIARKSFHLLAGTVALVMTVLATSVTPLLITGFIFAATLPASIALGISKIQTRERGYGTVAFAVGYVITAALFFEHRVVLVSALVVLTYGDGLAALVGKSFGRRRLGLIEGQKTLEGSLTFTAVSALGTTMTLLAHGAAAPIRAVAIGVVLGVLCAVVEATSTSDFDNGVLPVYAGIMTHTMLAPGGLFAVFTGFGLAFLIVSLALWRNWVTREGGVLAGLIVVTLFGIGGSRWLAPVVYLLASSSIVSSLARRRYRNPFRVREGPRGIGQIAAKGLPAATCGLAFAVSGDSRWFFVMLSIVATASADTFASAIGGLDPRESVPALPHFALVPKGISGGVSPYGTLAGLGAACLVAGMAPLGEGGVAEMAVVAGAGFVGANLDSVLGTWLQALYRCRSCGRITESEQHCDEAAQLTKGYRWMTNEWVNLASGVCSGLLAWILLAAGG